MAERLAKFARSTLRFLSNRYQKLQIIRQKIAANDTVWLYTPTNSRDAGRMLGFPPQMPEA